MVISKKTARPGLVSWGQERRSWGCGAHLLSGSAITSVGPGDLTRLVCGLSTLRLFKADLKISGWCYYTSEEETLAWR